MANKVKRKILILVALLVANVVGFLLADSYFDKHESDSVSATTIIESATKSGARILYTEKILGMGIEMLRKIGD